MNELSKSLTKFFRGGTLKRGAIFGIILLVALFAFEIFNYSTTQFALMDILGANLRFMGVEWATILAIAFCGIDFAGIARLFTPEQGRDEPAEVWYLFGAWLLAAAMNAILTWWGVSVAISDHQELSSLIMSRGTLTQLVPVFVAVMVWLIRVLIIGTFSMAGDRLFSVGGSGAPIMMSSLRPRLNTRPAPQPGHEQPHPLRPEPNQNRPSSRPEPTYHPAGFAARARDDDPGLRQ